MTESRPAPPAALDRDALREAIRAKYEQVASDPGRGFHFHVGRPLARMLDYAESDLDWLPAEALDSFAGTGNPLAMGAPPAGATVVDVGCGAGTDTLLAARAVGARGRVIAVDMTAEMLEKTRASAGTLGLENVETRQGYAEELPLEDAVADLVISNGVINLTPDKLLTLREIARVLKPGGRIQIGDIVVERPVPADARDDVELWSG